MDTSTVDDRALAQLYGITNLLRLPDERFDDLWDSIVMDPGFKDQLLRYVTFVSSPLATKLARSLSLHRITLLHGPPGTGKTTLCKGVASRAAHELKAAGSAGERMVFAEIETHRLMSGVLGDSPKQVLRTFGHSLRELSASVDVAVLLLDEVENIAVTRSASSLEANPVDVHRATNALLSSLDNLAASCPNLCLLATSNHVKALDEAFLSRIDLAFEFGLPPAHVRREILLSVLGELPDAGDLDYEDSSLTALVEASDGLSGRELRKLLLRGIVTAGPAAAAAPDIDVQTLLDNIMALATEGQDLHRVMPAE